MAKVGILEFVKGPVETTQGNTLFVEVVARPKEGVVFSNCSHLSLQWDLGGHYSAFPACC